MQGNDVVAQITIGDSNDVDNLILQKRQKVGPGRAIPYARSEE